MKKLTLTDCPAVNGCPGDYHNGQAWLREQALVPFVKSIEDHIVMDFSCADTVRNLDEMKELIGWLHGVTGERCVWEVRVRHASGKTDVAFFSRSPHAQWDIQRFVVGCRREIGEREVLSVRPSAVTKMIKDGGKEMKKIHRCSDFAFCAKGTKPPSGARLCGMGPKKVYAMDAC